MATTTTTTSPDTLVTLKINVEGSNRRFKLPLRDLGAASLENKLRSLLAIPSTSEAVFERFSDSAATFVVLDPNNTSVYKQLYRAAKAKLKLRLRVTIKPEASSMPKPATVEDDDSASVSLEEDTTAAQDDPVPAPAPAPTPSTVEQPTAMASVNELQSRFEDLLINHPRFTAPVVPSPVACTRPVDISNMPAPMRPDPRRGVPTREKWFAELAAIKDQRQNAIRNNTGAPAPTTTCSFSVYCNDCTMPIPDEHYHCSTCDDGDYDLCQKCVNDGILCGGDGHWMIKRFVKNGKVINSTTETIAPKVMASESKTTLVQPAEEEDATRTCNSCIQELPEEKFVTCTSCDDYDLCLACHISKKHGHHPKHAFAPAVEGADLDLLSKALLAPGRNHGHNAICDGCDKYIYGVRHKCLDCPDWDYCSSCIPNADLIHPRHRFVPIYEPINDFATISRSRQNIPQHYGIFCDGPLCNPGNGYQDYIKGVRYKCAVCHDTDFCANCEASPSSTHNKTHPLIKFKTPVRNVSVTTLGDHEDGRPMPQMGDRPVHPRTGFCTRNRSTETTPAQSTNAATQVQTVAELTPSEPVKVEVKAPETKVPEIKKIPVVVPTPVVKEDLVAHFVRDTVPDGTIFPPGCVFEQTWYLRNGGNTTWPAGCTVKFVGGDNMCAVDPDHPTSIHELVSAAESTTCYTEVAPGQEYGFTVLMRTPNRAGKFISYWRLTTSDGNKFGHRLWCDLVVKPSEVALKEQSEEIKKETDAEGSQMIFPKLEKESPASSVHQPAVVSTEPANEPVLEDEFEDFVDEPLDDEETDDGFMTDEEYDILDASDEEYLVEQHKLAEK